MVWHLRPSHLPPSFTPLSRRLRSCWIRSTSASRWGRFSSGDTRTASLRGCLRTPRAGVCVGGGGDGRWGGGRGCYGTPDYCIQGAKKTEMTELWDRVQGLGGCRLGPRRSLVPCTFIHCPRLHVLLLDERSSPRTRSSPARRFKPLLKIARACNKPNMIVRRWPAGALGGVGGRGRGGAVTTESGGPEFARWRWHVFATLAAAAGSLL